MQFVTVNKISPKWHTLNIETAYDIGGCLTASIIKNRHGKLSIWESIRYTHIRLYQKSARKLVTIIFLAENARATKTTVAFIIYTKHSNA